MFRALLSGLCFLALLGCRAEAPATDADPALWVVADADTKVYLFGTVHMLKPGLGWFDEAVRDAFDASDALVLELVMPPAEEMQALVEELGMAAAGTPLPETLPPEDAARLRSALTDAGLPADALDRADPWLAATTLTTLPLRELGYAEADGAERVLAEAAAQAGKPVRGLETAREQLRLFDGLPPAAQRQLLHDTLADLPQLGATIERMIGAWSRGDADALAAMLNEDLAHAPALAEALLVRRNRAWADWIARRMAQPGTVFVAVGAGHLAGPASVQAELARRGMRVERVQY